MSQSKGKMPVSLIPEAYKMLREYMYDHGCGSYSEAVVSVFNDIGQLKSEREAQELENDKLQEMNDKLQEIIEALSGKAITQGGSGKDMGDEKWVK